jgi:hypothetical protein
MVHDLESFYWVLLWICLLYMETNKSIGERSSIVANTMCPKVYAGTGGDGKSTYIGSPGILRGLEVYGKPVVAMLLKTWHAELGL